MSKPDLNNQSRENLYEVRRKVLAEVFELLLAISDNSNAGLNADDERDRHRNERKPLSRSQTIINDSVVGEEGE